MRERKPNAHAPGRSWCAGLPSVYGSVGGGALDFAFQSRVKAMHHWIRKGDAERAAKSAREALHQASAWLRHGGQLRDRTPFTRDG